jgi:SAM-dependent methyltransferase
LRLLGRLAPGLRVIEIGAGRGRLVAALREHGHDAVGIEPSRASSGAALARGLPVAPVALEESSFPAHEADVVVLWHVLEHLDSPAEALGRAHQWLKRDGRLVIAVPNLDSVQARIGGDRWFHQDVPRHRIQFTLRGVDELLRRCGFAPTRVRQVMIDQSPLGMWLTLLNRVTSGRDVPLRFLKRDLRYSRRTDAVRDAVVSVVVGIPLIPIAVLAELGAGLAGRGGTVVVHAAPA